MDETARPRREAEGAGLWDPLAGGDAKFRFVLRPSARGLDFRLLYTSALQQLKMRLVIYSSIGPTFAQWTFARRRLDRPCGARAPVQLASIPREPDRMKRPEIQIAASRDRHQPATNARVSATSLNKPLIGIRSSS